MHNKELILFTLEDIQFSLTLIKNRVKQINSSDDFLDTEAGLEKLDSISMRLAAMG